MAATTTNVCMHAANYHRCLSVSRCFRVCLMVLHGAIYSTRAKTSCCNLRPPHSSYWSCLLTQLVCCCSPVGVTCACQTAAQALIPNHPCAVQQEQRLSTHLPICTRGDASMTVHLDRWGAFPCAYACERASRNVLRKQHDGCLLGLDSRKLMRSERVQPHQPRLQGRLLREALIYSGT
jgi:hypothetical protein